MLVEMSRRLLQRTVNEGTARKQVTLILSSEMIAVFVIFTIKISIFVSRVEKYVSRTLDQNIVDPDAERIDTKRQLYRINSNSERSVGDSAMASSSTPSPVAGDHHLKKHLFLQGQTWTDILESLRSILVAINMHIIMFSQVLTRPSRSLKMKKYMISNDLQYFYHRVKCFHSF